MNVEIDDLDRHLFGQDRHRPRLDWQHPSDSRKVLSRDDVRQDIHGLRDRLSLEPVGRMLAHRISEDRRIQADRHLVGTSLCDFGNCLGLAVDPSDELIRPVLASLPQRLQCTKHDTIGAKHHVHMRMRRQPWSLPPERG
nr:hypothetical protein [Mesorhizobium sp. 131-2-5]